MSGAWRALLAATTVVLLCRPPAIALQAEVEVSVLHAPALVTVLGAPHLVHELWLTNRASAAVTLSELTVMDGARTLEELRGRDLESRLARPDLPRNHPSSLVMASGERAVVYFWIRLSADGALPRAIQHRLVFADPASAGSMRSASAAPAFVSPAKESVVLGPPVRGDGWAAVYDPVLSGGHRTAVYTVGGRPRIPGRFAIDWIRLLPSGRVHTDPTKRPGDWNGFGADVIAVSDGQVAAAVDGHPDLDEAGKPREVISRENASGNYVVLDLGAGRFAFYEHLQQGSIRVKAGDRVARAATIARVGSSGSVSSGPHLHFHVADANSLLGAEGLSFVLDQFSARGAFASIQSFAQGEAPVQADPGIARRRVMERPAPNAVVDFVREP